MSTKTNARAIGSQGQRTHHLETTDALTIIASGSPKTFDLIDICQTQARLINSNHEVLVRAQSRDSGEVPASSQLCLIYSHISKKPERTLSLRRIVDN